MPGDDRYHQITLAPVRCKRLFSLPGLRCVPILMQAKRGLKRTVVIGEAGQVTVMFRNSLNGARDLYFVRSEDGGKTFQSARKFGEGTWQLNACPMDGGGLTVNAAGRMVSVWRRQQQILLASPGEKEISLGQGKDPSVAQGKQGIYTAWTGPSGVQAGVQALIPGRADPLLLDTSGTYVQLLAPARGPVVAVWESIGAIFAQQLP